MTTNSDNRFVRINEGHEHILAGPYSREVAEELAKELQDNGLDAKVDD